MAVPESMTVLDISGRYTMVRGLAGLTLATSGRCSLPSRYIWPIKLSQRSSVGRRLLHLCRV